MSQIPFQIVDPQRPSLQFEGKCALAIMAKVPRAGRVKTRLSPPLNPQQAAALNIGFLKDTIECLKEVSIALPAYTVISFAPRGEEAGFKEIVPDDVILVPQRGDGFGERLQHTAEDLLRAGFRAVCLIDSDSPTVPAAAYAKAVQTLLAEEDCAVLGPSDDGGYYLLGLNALHPRLFEEIAWSTEIVADQTKARSREIGLPMYSLPIWFDVDDRRTLARLYRELILSPSDGSGFRARHTRHFLETVDRQIVDELLASSAQVEGVAK
jgi:uncharacterized protein